MLIKEIAGFKVLFQPVPDGYTVTVSDGKNEKIIPLLPDQIQVERTIDALGRTEIDGNISLEYFSMIVAGCLSLNMKRVFG
jgi:hypothetical protein